MSTPSLQPTPDSSFSQTFFNIAFRPRVPQPTTPKALPHQESPPTPHDDEMVDLEPGEVIVEKAKCMSHTPESSSRPSTVDTRYRSRSPRRERRRHDVYRDRSRSCSPIRKSPRDYRERSFRRERMSSTSTEDQKLSTHYFSSPPPSLHPTGGWEADFWPPLRQTSPRSRGVPVSDRYCSPPKTFLEQIEERRRMENLREAGAPHAPKALREQVEAQAETIALITKDIPEGSRSLEIALKKQGVTGWFPNRPVEACPGRRNSVISFGEGYKGDTMISCNHECTVSQNDGRLSRPEPIDGQDEDMHDDANINEKFSTQDEAAFKPLLNAKGTKLKSTFNQLQSWISDQPIAIARPLPTVPRSYPPSHSQHHTLSRVLHTAEEFEDLSAEGAQMQPLLRMPTCMQVPHGYPQEDLNYD